MATGGSEIQLLHSQASQNQVQEPVPCGARSRDLSSLTLESYDAVNPILSQCLSENNEDEQDEEDVGSAEDELDADILFYDRTKRPAKKICPFSDALRDNPCTNYSEPRSRKDQIMKHLNKVRNAGGDAHHPLDDPLWNSFAVKWFLSPKPPKLTLKKRKAAKARAESRYYFKRKKIQNEFEPPMRKLFEEGALDKEEYKKYLIGNKRREFIAELRARAKIEKELKDESERKLQEVIENRLQQLRIEERGPDPTTANTATIAIQELESARNDIAEKDAMVRAYREVLTTQASNVVEFYTDDTFLSTDKTYLQYHGFDFPNKPSVVSFYTFATFLIPPSKWSTQIRSASVIRHMQQELHDFINTEKENVEEEDKVALDGLMGCFNSCCDIIREEEQRTISMSINGAQAWYEEHDKMWNDAQEAFYHRFKLNTRAPIQLVRLIDEFADTWRAQKRAEEESEVAVLYAQRTADSSTL